MQFEIARTNHTSYVVQLEAHLFFTCLSRVCNRAAKQARVSGACTSGSITTINDDGTVVCSAPPVPVSGSCSTSAIQSIGTDGSVTCSSVDMADLQSQVAMLIGQVTTLNSQIATLTSGLNTATAGLSTPCQFTAWTNWTACRFGPDGSGIQNRSRAIVAQAVNAIACSEYVVRNVSNSHTTPSFSYSSPTPSLAIPVFAR